MREIYKCILFMGNKLPDVMDRQERKQNNTLRELKVFINKEDTC